MSTNTETPRHPSGGSQEVLFATGGTDASVARPLVLITRGRIEYLAHCPSCKDWHRHVHLGTVTGPCGTEYELQPRRGRTA